jgi:hypothetical protein
VGVEGKESENVAQWVVVLVYGFGTAGRILSGYAGLDVLRAF